MFVVDTNILVYAADADSPYHERCLERIDAWRSGADAWFLTWEIVYEFLRITTHPKVMRKPWTAAAAWRFVSILLDSPGLSLLVPTERHPDVVGQVLAEIPDLGGNLVHDAHVAVLMREHGIRRVYTRDVDFHRFPFLEPVDPVGVALHEAAPRTRARRPARRSRS